VQNTFGPVCRDRDPEAAAEQKEEPVARIVLGDHHLPRGYVRRFKLLGQLKPGHLVKGSEKRNSSQERAQFASVMQAGHGC
jgi:hypothetical protein